jgi:hypothetical protein
VSICGDRFTATESGVEDVFGQGRDQARTLGQRDELVGWDRAVGACPSRERFRTDHLPGHRIDFRLVGHLHHLVLDGGAEIGQQGESPRGVLIIRRLIHVDAGARLFGDVHGDVGPLQQPVRIGAVAGGQADSDACLGGQGEPGNHRHAVQCPVQLRRVLEHLGF